MTITNIVTNVTTSGTNNYSWWSILNQWLMGLSYKPGWSFEVRDNGYNNTGYYQTLNTPVAYYPGLNLVVTAKVMDSTTLEETLIVHTLPLEAMACQSQDGFLIEVLRCIKMIEVHEAMEFLKVNGVRVRNPHPSPTRVLYP